MSPSSLAVCFGPVLMLHSDDTGVPLDFQQPIGVLKYLLEIWPVKSGNVIILPRLFTYDNAFVSRREKNWSKFSKHF